MWPVPMAYLVRLWYWVRMPAGSDVCHRGCAYRVFNTVQRPGECSAGYGTVHYKKPLKLLDKSRALSPDLVLLSFAILS